jgi:hypothetical protein
VDFHFVSVLISHLLSLLFCVISHHHASTSRRLWVALERDCGFGSDLGSGHVMEIHLFGIVTDPSLFAQCEGNEIHPLNICGWVNLDSEKNLGVDG